MTSWSEPRITTLRTLWRDGLSASQIAKQLGGVTRNAVIGKVHRLGLSGRGQPSAPGHTSRPRVTRVARPRRPVPARTPPSPKPPRPLAPAAVAPAEGPGLVADLALLGVHACKWPIGDPKSPAFSFCGRHATGRYCAAHEAVGVRAGTTWRVDRDPVVRRALAGLI